MRSLMIILVLAAPALAGEGSWQTVKQGDGVLPFPQPATPGGNALRMEVTAHDLLTVVDGYAHTDLFHEDEDGSASDSGTSWYTLKFVGSANTTDHRWRITTRVVGIGIGRADSALDGSGWAESIQLVKFTGDNENHAVGQLAVEDATGGRVSLGFPPGLRVSGDKRARSKGTDGFNVSRAKTTSGKGKACRVRVEVYAEASVSARCLAGMALAFLDGDLRGDLEMTGSSRVGDTIVEDTFRVDTPTAWFKKDRVTPPSDGLVIGGADDVPTDTPTDDEREGAEDDLPRVDAKDAPSATPKSSKENDESSPGSR